MRGFSNGGGGAADMILKIAPIACSFFAFLFMAIALSSGMKPNYLEGISIIHFNMSTLGKNLIKAPDVAEAAKGGCNKAGNGVSDAADKIGDGLGKVGGLFGAEDEVNDAIDSAGDTVGGAAEDACNKGAEVANQAVQLTADAVDKVMGSIAKAIGIKEYYSLHIGALCEGDYKPLFSDPEAEPDVQECTPKFRVQKTDLSKKLDEELQVGPFKFKLSDLDLVEAIQKAFDLIPRALAAMGVFFLLATVSITGGFLLSLVVFVTTFAMQGLQKLALLAALTLTGFGWFLSLIGVIGITVVAEKVKNAVNEHGDKFGMSAATSAGLYFLIWASLVFSTLALAMLVVLWLRRPWEDDEEGEFGGQGGEYAEKNQSASTMQDDHGFYQEPINGGPAQSSSEPMYGGQPQGGRY
ncbi:SUR7/PalI family-domain-containing protein [Achaetomium macrosporum]|uniref:SUR7/PalI family-domain-containing protein n=1 Tax=Achaetomium macrosporum TaxID=79813 RepID=A0AAN7C4K8_9PEZI|nr:SUR7/PalI family-domain-containing protein [Achaetomium macrosporum]